MRNKVLVAGASGVVGAAAVEAFLREGWEVVALSRRAPEIAGSQAFTHLAVDLQDAAASRAALGALTGVTHLVYTALFEKPGLIAGWQEQDQMNTNLAMLKNCLEPLEAAGNPLQHVSLLQGTKAYGIHLHPMPIPARERNPRDPHANFYWLQEDYLKERAATSGFAWTILRPQLIIGSAYGVAMNLAPVIGAYGAICRELGEPMGYPGGISWVWEAVDARLLANRRCGHHGAQVLGGHDDQPGAGGGEIVVAGTPEDVAREKRSYTGHFLKDVLRRGKKQAAE